jgi:fucose permease
MIGGIIFGEIIFIVGLIMCIEFFFPHILFSVSLFIMAIGVVIVYSALDPWVGGGGPT